MNPPSRTGSVILVRGAWADGSCWSNVILRFRHQGLNVISALLASDPAVSSMEK